MEMEPSMAWNPVVLGGIGIVERTQELYDDMHAYLVS
jgi:raffinose synthase